ncbi:hypothetical protein ACX1C1_05215 [Paenibacillus sp. strain BS8-2]
MKVNGLDTFFLTFIATWFSVRITKWANEGADSGLEYGALPLISLIMGVFFFTMFISWIRDCRYRGIFSFSSLLLIIALIGLILNILVQVGWFRGYIKAVDLHVFLCLAVLWILAPLVEGLNRKFNLKDLKNALGLVFPKMEDPSPASAQSSQGSAATREDKEEG